jgi:hypothetical protein
MKENNPPFKNQEHQWLMPIILATQQAEIKRNAVQSQPGQIVCKTLLKNTQHKKKRAGGVVQVVEHLPSLAIMKS